MQGNSVIWELITDKLDMLVLQAVQQEVEVEVDIVEMEF